MNWSKASAIAEIFSSIAIVVTLIYLAIQTQQNTAALQTSARQTTVSSDVEILLSRVQDPSIEILMFEDNLTVEDRVKVNSYLLAVLRLHYHNWLEHEAGTLDDAGLSARQGGLIGVLSSPNGRRWWTYFLGLSVPMYSSEFEEYVNDLLEGRPISDVPIAVAAFE